MARRYVADVENELYTLAYTLDLEDDGSFRLERHGAGFASVASYELRGTWSRCEEGIALAIVDSSSPDHPAGSRRILAELQGTLGFESVQLTPASRTPCT